MVVDLFKDFTKDHKTIFQALKLLTLLVKENKDKLSEFVVAGIPGKIIKHFNNEWPVDIIKDSILLFSRMS